MWWANRLRGLHGLCVLVLRVLVLRGLVLRGLRGLRVPVATAAAT